MFVPNLAAGALEIHGAGVRLGRLVEKIEYARRRGQTALQVLVHRRQALQGRNEQHCRDQERDESADGRLIGRGLQHSEVNDHRDADRYDQLHDGPVGGCGRLALHVEAPHLRRLLAEARLLVSLAAEYLHHLDACRGLAQHLVQVAHSLLRALAHGAQAPTDGSHHEHDRRCDQEGEQGEFPVEVEQVAHQRQDGEPVLDHHCRDAAGAESDLHSIEREPGDERSAGGTLEEARGQREQPPEHLLAQVEHHLVAEPIRAVDRNEGPDAVDQHERDDEGRRKLHPEWVPLDEGAVQQGLHERRERGLCERGNRHAHHRDQEAPPVWEHIAEQPAIQGHAVVVGGRICGRFAGTDVGEGTVGKRRCRT